MAEPLKNSFGPDVPGLIGDMVIAVYPAFDRGSFVEACLNGYDELELTPRARHIADGLANYLPADRVRALIEKLQPHVSATLVVAESAAEAVRDVAIVCTATSSTTPVLDGSLLAPGTHVNAIGSFTTEMCEIDARTIERAHVFVDSVAAAAAEAGDLLAAESAGATQRQDWTELGRVVTGTAPGRDGNEITLFKSVGLAVQDIAAAGETVARARAAGLGTEVLV